MQPCHIIHTTNVILSLLSQLLKTGDVKMAETNEKI